jgi:hypothetical protein
MIMSRLRKYHYSIAFIIGISMMMIACNDRTVKKVVQMGPIRESEDFDSLIDSIRLVLLSSDQEAMLGSEVEIKIFNDCYYLADYRNKKILRFDSRGNYLNSIGNVGRAINEYYTIQSFQVIRDSVVVFSYPQKLLVYDSQGLYLKSQTEKLFGEQSYLIGNTIYTYYGYKRNRPYRLAKITNGNVEKKFLPTSKYVMTMSRTEPVFTPHEKGCFVLDSYSPIVYNLVDDGLEEYVSFDFGKYRISDDFYEYEDPVKGAESLLSSEFAYIHRFFENQLQKIVVVVIQSEDKVQYVYGITGKEDCSWQWFQSPFAEDLKMVDDKCLYYVLDYYKLKEFSSAMRNKIMNKEIMDITAQDSNYVIAKVYLH